MRRIDKTKILSKVYKAWEEEVEANGGHHGSYSSSSHRFFYDVVMNLYHCQNGLCAYTEQALCPPDKVEAHHWRDGCYQAEAVDHYGELDHFDPHLKTEKAWLWDNLFMVHGSINRKKRSQVPDPMLKPDSPDYDPIRLLEYNEHTHMFTANARLPEDQRGRINETLLVLGINHDMVRYERKKSLSRLIKKVQFGVEAVAPDQLECFRTAYEVWCVMQARLQQSE